MDMEARPADPRGKILALGELLVDLVPVQEGMRIRDTGTVLKTASGSAGIFACAAARLGAPTGFIGRVGSDPLSCMVTDAIRKEGVDTRFLTVSEEGQIGLAFLEYTDKGRNYQYYRSNSVGSRLGPADVKEEWFSTAFAVHFPGMLLDLTGSMREACLRAADLAGKHGVLLSFDPNIRREMTQDPEAKNRMLEMVHRADILSPTLEEGRLLTGQQSLRAVLGALLDMGPKTVALTMDKNGALLYLSGKVFLASPAPVEEVDPTGAGDTFAAALCTGLREGMEPGRLAQFCCAAGALAVTRRGAIGMALPDRAEVDALVDAGSCQVRETTLQQLE